MAAAPVEAVLQPCPASPELRRIGLLDPLVDDRLLRSAGHCKARRKGPRRRSEIEAERQALWEKTEREIDALVNEFHALLSRDQADHIGAIYARYSTRFQDSIADQVRAILHEAVRQRIFVPREYIFFDLAVRGCREQRQGFGQLRALLARKAVQVLLLFATNRLFRKAYKALEFVDQVVKEWGIRCLFIKSGIDTDDKKRWEMLLQAHAMIDQFGVSMYADNVRAAHAGLFDQLLVFGTVTFGYKGEPVEGQFTRRQRPRCRLAIDLETAAWVVQIFTWYVEERQTIAAIVQRLNADPTAPLPPRCTSGAWSFQSVRGVLTNARYRGFWEYGKTEAIWIASKDYARQMERPEPLQQAQVEELRIVSDERWFAAQRRLAENKGGRKPQDGNRQTRPKLLNGLFRCSDHDQPLYVGGAYGQTMFCPECQGLPAATRPLYSLLNRQLAVRLTCEKLASLVQQDAPLIQQVITACQEAAASLQQSDPSHLVHHKARADQLKRAIDFALRNVGDSAEAQAETSRLLRQLRTEWQQELAEISRLEAAAKHPLVIPTEAEVADLVGQLGRHLTAAALDEDEVKVSQVRGIIEQFCGGRIDLSQQGERRPQRGWLQGRFRVRLLSHLVQQLTGQAAAVGADAGIEVAIDYRETDASEAEINRAKEFYDQGKLNCQIAAELGCGRNWVSELLRRWHVARGLPVPDGRKRRATLVQKQSDPARYQELADRAKALWDEKLADLQIAARLGCSPPTAAAAVACWHTARGLPVPSQAERRAALIDRMQALYEGDQLIRSIAREVGLCSRSVTLLLRERFRSLGREMEDGRTRSARLHRQGHQPD